MLQALRSLSISSIAATAFTPQPTSAAATYATSAAANTADSPTLTASTSDGTCGVQFHWSIIRWPLAR